MLQRMEIKSSSSSSFPIENYLDGRQSLQPRAAAQGGDRGVHRPILKWGRGRPDNIGERSMTLFHPTPAGRGQKNGDSEDDLGILGNFGGSVPLGACWDPNSSISRWGKRQTLPPHAPLDVLVQNCQPGNENQTSETFPTQGPVLTPLCARLGNSVPSMMWHHHPERAAQHKLTHLVDDKARQDMGWSRGTSVIWGDPVQMSPWARGTRPLPDLEQKGVSEGGKIISPGPRRNIPQQDSTGASNLTEPVERSKTGRPLNPLWESDASQDESAASDPITPRPAQKEGRNLTAATDVPNPGFDLGTCNVVAMGNRDSIISAQTLGQDAVAGFPPLGPDSSWGKKGDYGGTPDIVGQAAPLETLAPHQKVENTPSRKKRRATERRTGRWTERIKERWRDRRTSLGKSRMGQRTVEGGTDEMRSREEEREEPQQCCDLK
ncbi:hypothetical protein SKAU_G00031690 [Synaphobranchus kaupii]|uniref:Uncharacterized protein n=1 Tax=Synaphobranchus kaupii TaxID=118154 RepID=A0A9Q1JD80_SYNKA|nr:hypothetical protein SKAU_G00031690 [Synaphobranchus kaupii]